MARIGLNPDKTPRQIVVNKYLKCFPKPLLEDLVKSRWLPIVGAGMSRNAVLASGRTMPLWKQLGKALADEMPAFEFDNTIDAISAYSHEFRRPRLIEKLSDLLYINEAQPGDAHRAFCEIPFDVVCTTNFDFLLERQYELIPKSCTPLIDEDQLSVNVHGLSIALLKLHGDLNHPNRLVVTEEDYDAFLERYPVLATYLANFLITRTPVLIGYSMDDPDFRQLWQIVEERLGKARRMAYALCVGASQTEVARFNRRRVNVINLAKSKNRAGQVLAETFIELRNYWLHKNPIRRQAKGGGPLAEVAFPIDRKTKLCFLAIPKEALSFYRAYVFPLVEEVGLVPMTVNHVIPPTGNIFATTDAMVSQASLIVVDTSSGFAVAEARRAIAREKPIKVLVVAQKGTSIPFDLSGMEILYRPKFTSRNVGKFPDDFLERLTTTLEGIEPRLEKERHRSIQFHDIEGKLAQERHRLLQSNEYRAAVISAITHLETALRRRFDVIERNDRGFVSVTNMINIAKHRKFLGNFDVRQVLEWIEIRNQVVHSDVSVSRNDAKAIVEGVDRITNGLYH